MSKPLLLPRPVEKLGGYSWISLHFKNFGYEFGGNATELLEIRNDFWAPVFVFTEGVADVTGNGGEGLSYMEVFFRLGFRGEGSLGGVWIPFVEMELWGCVGDWEIGVWG